MKVIRYISISLVLCIVLCACGNYGTQLDNNTDIVANADEMYEDSLSSGEITTDVYIEQNSEENEVLSDTEKKITLEEIEYVELDELQNLFCEISTLKDRDDIYNTIKDTEFKVHWFQGYHYNASACYIGLTGSSVSSRPRDRKGAVIYVDFSNDGMIEQMGYTIGGSASYFSDFELIYTNGQFLYDGDTYDDGVAAMQLYLANTKVSED